MQVAARVLLYVEPKLHPKHGPGPKCVRGCGLTKPKQARDEATNPDDARRSQDESPSMAPRFRILALPGRDRRCGWRKRNRAKHQSHKRDRAREIDLEMAPQEDAAVQSLTGGG